MNLSNVDIFFGLTRLYEILITLPYENYKTLNIEWSKDMEDQGHCSMM